MEIPHIGWKTLGDIFVGQKISEMLPMQNVLCYLPKCKLNWGFYEFHSLMVWPVRIRLSTFASLFSIT